jgi:hypothetical protein
MLDNLSIPTLTLMFPQADADISFSPEKTVKTASSYHHIQSYPAIHKHMDTRRSRHSHC